MNLNDNPNLEAKRKLNKRVLAKMKPKTKPKPYKKPKAK